MEDDFDKVLLREIKGASRRSGNEWVIPLAKVKQAIELAGQHAIAVLGVELFRLLSEGVATEGYSGYDFEFGGNWASFVSKNNQSAAEYVEEHQSGEAYGYILTTASENEFARLRDHTNG